MPTPINLDRFAGSAPVPDDAEGAMQYRAGDWHECCHCRRRTLTVWKNYQGKRIAAACSFEHLSAGYPAYTWEAD